MGQPKDGPRRTEPLILAETAPSTDGASSEVPDASGRAGAIRCHVGRGAQSARRLDCRIRAGLEGPGQSAPHPGPGAIECFAGGRAPARLSSQHGSAPSPRLMHKKRLSKSSSRHSPRSSILAQLGGVALLAERDPRHPVIGDSSGRSTGRATGTGEANPQATSTHNRLRRPGRPAVLRVSSCRCAMPHRRLGGEQPPIARDAV